MAKTKASWWWLGTIATVVAIAIALGVVLGLGLTNNDSDDSSASISEVLPLTGERKSNAFAAAANVRQVAMIPPEGVASAEDSQARRRLLEAVTPVDVGAFASDSDYSKAPKATMYVDSLTKEVFQTPSMVLCFMSSTNWTKNRNTGPYIAEIDPYNCDNPDGERIKGQITYRWVVEATGPDLDDENDPLDEFKGHVWVTITDDPEGPMEIDTRLIIKRSDVVVRGDDLFIKKLTFQYQSGGMKGLVIKEVEIGDNDSKPTAEGIKFYERVGDDEEFFELGAVSRTEYDANGIATSTKAAFKELDWRDFSYINGYMVTTDSLAKLQFRGQEYCDQLHNRSFLGDRYAAFDDSGEKSHIVSFVNLQATGSDDEIYQAFMHYPGNLYVSEYSDTGRMEDSAIAIATAAFADGKTVTQVVDWNDPSKNLNRVLKFSRGVLYKIEPTIQPVTNYMDTIIQGWFWDEETYDSAMVKIKYDSDTSTLMLLSKQIYECTSDTCDLGSNTITTPRALSMDDIGNNPIECWGSFGQTGATLLNLTHYKVASSVPVKAGELDADLTLTCGERCALRYKMADDDEVTDEERLNIVQHYLLSSPPCQFNEVLEEVKKLVPDGLLTDSFLAGIARAHHSKGKIIDAPSGTKSVLCEAGEVDPTHYVDSKSGTVFQFHHLTNEASEDSTVAPIDQSLELKRAAIQSTLDKYVKNVYHAEDSAAGVFAKDGKISIVLVGEKKNLRNFWSGKITSAWTLDATSSNLSGEMKIHAHYFEDGNVQLQTSKASPATTIPGGSEAELASGIEKHIREFETSVQDGLEEMYVCMNEETFKSMRRTLPISRTKMEWNVNAVKMVRQLHAGKS